VVFFTEEADRASHWNHPLFVFYRHMLLLSLLICK
jgi:hypothetical protein